MNVKSLLIALISGTLFGLGLSVAQMIDPAKVVNFLDITGSWDPFSGKYSRYTNDFKKKKSSL